MDAFVLPVFIRKSTAAATASAASCAHMDSGFEGLSWGLVLGLGAPGERAQPQNRQSIYLTLESHLGGIHSVSRSLHRLLCSLNRLLRLSNLSRRLDEGFRVRKPSSSDSVMAHDSWVCEVWMKQLQDGAASNSSFEVGWCICHEMTIGDITFPRG